VSCISIGKFRLSHNIDSIDGKFPTAVRSLPPAPNRRSAPPAKSEGNTSCLDVFEILSLNQHGLEIEAKNSINMLCDAMKEGKAACPLGEL
jgi:hypothetical protein